MARHPDDFYRTPPDAVLALHDLIGSWPGFTVDPCAGDGGLIAACAMIWGAQALGMRGVELDAGRSADAAGRGWRVEQGDGLERSWSGENVAMNPPFQIAPPFVEKAAHEAESAAVLLPIAYLSSAERSDWWRSLPPPRLRVMSVRPSFQEDGRTSTQDYAWYLWGRLYADAPPVSWFCCPFERKLRLEHAASARALRADQVNW